jgi:sugar/nucleoside kinase (ribokinase family)
VIICYGSLGPDIEHRVLRLPGPGEDLPSQSWRMSYGGGAASPAVALAAWGREVAVAGHEMGDDPLGRWLLADLQARGIDTARVVVRPDVATPHCVVLVTPDGERTIVSSGYAGLRWHQVTSWVDIEALIVDGYSGSAGAAVAREARERSVPVVGVDVLDTVEADVVVWSRAEHPEERRARELATDRTVVLTDGPHPVTVLRGHERWMVRPPSVEARDVTGAGHMFAAMWTLALRSGWLPEWTMRMAASAASLLVQAGREAGTPSLAAVQRAAEDLLTSESSPESDEGHVGRWTH